MINVELSECGAFRRYCTKRSGFSWSWPHAVQKGPHVHKNTQKTFIMKPAPCQFSIGTSRFAVVMLNKWTFKDHIRPNSLWMKVYIVLTTCSGYLMNPLYVNTTVFRNSFMWACRSQWPCGLRPRSANARFLESRVRFSLRAWMFVPCVYCVLCR